MFDTERLRARFAGGCERIRSLRRATPPSAEASFLIALARGDVERCAAIPIASIDADRLEQLAVRHQVEALCWWMSRTARDFVWPSAKTCERFRARFIYHRFRHEALVRDLGELSRILSRDGLSAMFMKGPWLASHAYPNPGLRPMADIDLCVRETEYEPVVQVLREIGYRPISTLPPDGKRALRQAHYGAQLRFEAHERRHLELHFRMVNMGPPRSDEQWVWQTSRAVSLGDFAIRVPGPEAMLVHLILHAAQHGFASLRMLHDIRWALERDRAAIDPALLFESIGSLRSESIAHWSMTLAREQAGAATEALEPSSLRPGPARRRIQEWIWNIPAARALTARGRSVRFEAPRLYLLGMGRQRDKLRYLAGIARQAIALRTAPRAAAEPASRVSLARWSSIAWPALVAAAVYATTLWNDLAGDDPWTYQRVSENPEIWQIAGGRAVTYAAHALDLWLWPGSYAALHATNLALHALATALAASMAWRLSGSHRVGLLCGLLFAVHPVHVEAVASFSNRKDILAMIFLMLALHCWLTRGRNGVRILGTPIFLGLSLWSKEVAAIGAAITFPLALLVTARVGTPAFAGRGTARRIAIGSAVLVIFAGSGAASLAGNLQRYFEAPSIRELLGTHQSYGEVLATVLATFPSVVRLLVLPVSLSVDYPAPVPDGFGSASVLGGALLAAAAAIASIAALGRTPVVGYGGVWALAMYLPASNVVPLTQYFLADRYLYVPSFGVCLAVAAGIVGLRRLAPEGRAGLRFAAGLLVGALIVAGAARSVRRNADWANQWTLYSSALASGFETARVHRGVGYGYLAHGDPGAAADQFRKAIALDPRLAYQLAGPLAAAQTLLGEYSQTTRVPQEAEGLALIGKALLAGGRRETAIAMLRTATRDDPRHGSDLAWILAAHPAATPDQMVEAERAARSSSSGDPRHRAWALCAVAVARMRSGDYSGAVSLAEAAIHLAETGSNRWVVSVAELVRARAARAHPVVLPTRILFGLLWRTHFEDFGEPQCHPGTSVPVLGGILSFDAAEKTFRAHFLTCGAPSGGSALGTSHRDGDVR